MVKAIDDRKVGEDPECHARVPSIILVAKWL